jgi:serine/threonine protein kinase
LRKDKTKKFALKAMKKQDIIQSKHVDHIENEKKILELMNHPFIMRYYGFMQDDRYIYFVTELLKGVIYSLTIEQLVISMLKLLLFMELKLCPYSNTYNQKK